MGRDRFSTDKEIKELVRQYEQAIDEGKSIYLDSDQITDISSHYCSYFEFDKGQQVLNYGLTLHPESSDLLLEQAYLYLDLDKIDKAKEIANLLTDELGTRLLLLKAEILINEDKLEEANTMLREADITNDINDLIDTVYMYLDMNLIDYAMEWLELGLSLYENECNSEAFQLLCAECYSCDELYAHDGIEIYNRYIDKKPYDASLWVGLAKCYLLTKEFDEAMNACDFAISADPEYGDAHVTYANIFLQLENPEKAIEEFKKALNCKNTSHNVILMYLGMSYYQLDEWETAYNYFVRAEKLMRNKRSPYLIELYETKALSLMYLNRYEESHKACKIAIEIGPESSTPYLIEGTIYFAENRISAAKNSWEDALVRCVDEDEKFQLLVQMGMSCVQQSYVADGISYFERAHEIDSTDQFVIEKLTILSIMKQNTANFVKYSSLLKTPFDYNHLIGLLEKLPDKERNDELLTILRNKRDNNNN